MRIAEWLTGDRRQRHRLIANGEFRIRLGAAAPMELRSGQRLEARGDQRGRKRAGGLEPRWRDLGMQGNEAPRNESHET